jgi:hypothetical protein
MEREESEQQEDPEASFPWQTSDIGGWCTFPAPPLPEIRMPIWQPDPADGTKRSIYFGYLPASQPVPVWAAEDIERAREALCKAWTDALTASEKPVEGTLEEGKDVEV